MANNKVYTDYLMHGRTKGSKNGISTTPGYRAVGQKAKGQWINGRYVYYEDEARNRAYRQGEANKQGMNQAYANQSMVKRMENARKADVQDQKIYGKKIEGYTRLADISPYERQRLANKYLENNPQHQTAVNQHNAETAGRNAALAYAQKQKAKKPTNVGASQAGDAARAMSEYAKTKSNSKYTSSHQNAVSQAAAERQAREAALNRQKKGLGHPRNDYIRPESARAYREAYENAVRLSKQEETFMGKPASQVRREQLSENTKAAKKESQARNSRSDIGNAFADAKEDAKNLFKKLKSKKKKK